LRPALVYLIRHGQTPLNAQGLIRGRLDEPLDQTGQHQAEALGRLFQGVTIARVLASPLQRARCTAAPIAASAGMEVEIDPGLNDRDYGEWAGHPRAEVEQRFGSVNAAPGVEPWEALTSRVVAAFEAIVAGMDRQRPVVIVGHDAVNRALLSALIPDLATAPDTIPQRTGCWSRLERTPQDWRIGVLDAIPGDGHEP
ncbi:MAG TPA: histidine phosphatase family protein, partial [Nitrococcus sp.]|nr:histidine phosphatase family protein [Nitrococcus sp.]